mgnify:CR=1 FL=1
MKNKKSKKDKDLYGLAIPGGLLIGIGVGFITGNIPAYTLIGLGLGFLLAMILGRK